MTGTHDRIHPSFSIVIADDEESITSSISYTLRSNNITNLVTVNDSREVMATLDRTDAGVLFIDLTMPHITGQELIPQIKSKYPHIAVIVVTGNTEIETAIECMRYGLADYLIKPIETEKLVATCNRIIEIKQLELENSTLKRYLMSQDIEHPEAFSAIITRNKAMKALFLYVESVGQTDRPVLVTGETGVGKELFAQAIHRVSSRRDNTFLAVNLASFDETTFNDTLFGHLRGSYTGADTVRKGLVESASGGTLFLDEIGDLSPACQVKLLRLIEALEYFPLGSDVPKRSNARLVCATNRDLKKACDSGSFRNDLYYRLITHHVHIPALRDRTDDISLLVEYFVDEAAIEFGKSRPVVPPEFHRLLRNSQFPGNVRELRSIIYDAVSLEKTQTLSLDHLLRSLGSAGAPEPDEEQHGAKLVFPDELPTIKALVNGLVDEALRRSGGNQTIAARMLGITQQALNKRVRQRK